MPNPIRILIADDHPVVRDGLVAILSTQPDFEVIGEAGTGVEVIEQIMALEPDVVLLDLRKLSNVTDFFVLLDLEMPELDGVAALQQLQQSTSKVRAIVFTAFDTDERILEAVQAGAQGYLLKGVPRDELFSAIRVVHTGGSLLQPVVASKLLRQVSQHEQTTSDIDPLTPREVEVLRLLAQGLQNKEIASELVISERTVKFHVSSIMGKLGAGNRTEAVTIAAQQGLIDLR